MDPFHEHCLRHIQGGGAQGGQDFGDVYKSILHQRGFGLDYGMDLDETYGTGLMSFLAPLGRAIGPILMPFLKSSMKTLGGEVLNAASNVAKDVVTGKSLGQSAKDNFSAAAQNVAEDVFARAPALIDNFRNKRRKRVSRVSAGKVVASKRAKVGRGVLETYPALSKIV